MSTIDVSKLWRIMPFVTEGEEAWWWVLGPEENVSVSSPYAQLTREEAFAIALKHNKAHGLSAVYVHSVTGDDGQIVPGGGFFQWEGPPTEAQAASLMELLKHREGSPEERIEHLQDVLHALEDLQSSRHRPVKTRFWEIVCIIGVLLFWAFVGYSCIKDSYDLSHGRPATSIFNDTDE